MGPAQVVLAVGPPHPGTTWCHAVIAWGGVLKACTAPTASKTPHLLHKLGDHGTAVQRKHQSPFAVATPAI